MSMEEFYQPEMNSVLMSEPNTPHFSRRNNNNNNSNETPFNVAQNLHNLSIVTNDMNSPDFGTNGILIDNNEEMIRNDKRATRHDYLDYGNYINKVLCSQLLSFTNNSNNINSTQNGSIEIDWNFNRTQDKVDVVNLILQLIEQRSMFQNLLSQSRDAMDQLKRQIQDSHNKVRDLQQTNKEQSLKLQQTQQRYDLLHADYRKEIKDYKNKQKELTKENENYRYKDKKYFHDIRKLENSNRGLQEKVKRLLDDREKKAHKMIGMKLLNQTKTSVFAPNLNKSQSMISNVSMNSHNNNNNESNNSNNNNNNNNNKRRSQSSLISPFEMNQMKEEQNHMIEENRLLQSQISHLQQQMANVLKENSKLRESLLGLETQCKDTFNKVTNVMISMSEDNSSDLATLTQETGNYENEINSYKYEMPFEISCKIIHKDIDSSINNLEKAINHAQSSIHQSRIIGQNNNILQNEMNALKNQINDLTQKNIEYEKLIRNYVSNET